MVLEDKKERVAERSQPDCGTKPLSVVRQANGTLLKTITYREGKKRLGRKKQEGEERGKVKRESEKSRLLGRKENIDFSPPHKIVKWTKEGVRKKE